MTQFGLEDPQPREKRDPWPLVLGVLGGVLLGTGVTFAILGFVGVFEEPTPPTIPPPPSLTTPPPVGPPPTLGESVDATDIASRVIPSTVFINVSSMFTAGGGSGVVYGTDGYIVTNDHVVDGARDISVTFSDGGSFPAEVIGTDPFTDIAVLRVGRTDLVPIDVGTSSDLAIGEPAIAVGNPLGLPGGPSVTLGVVSALNRWLEFPGAEPLYGLVQTDAPIAPGSSGGALVDAEARLVGITTAIAVSDVGAGDLGFAVPVDIVVDVVADLINTRTVDHARLGLQGQTAFAESDGAEYPVGILVTDLSTDSAYEEAGGQINDVIVELDGVAVSTIPEMLATLRGMRAGQVIDARILRADDELVLDIELGRLDS